MPKMRALNSPKTQRLQSRSKKKAVPLGNNKHKQNLQIKNSLSLGGEMSRRDREGRLAFINRLPTTSPPIPATAKQEPKMSRPPWGKVAGVSLTEGGDSLTNLDCVPTNAPTPTTTVQLTRTIHARPYNSASELPPHRALTGPPPTQRGRLIQFQYLLL